MLEMDLIAMVKQEQGICSSPRSNLYSTTGKNEGESVGESTWKQVRKQKDEVEIVLPVLLLDEL